MIVAEALQPGVNVSAVARRHGIKPSFLFRWKKLAKSDAKPEPAPAFLPVSVTAPAKRCDTICDRTTSKAPAGDNRIEIELLNGRRVRVGPGAEDHMTMIGKSHDRVRAYRAGSIKQLKDGRRSCGACADGFNQLLLFQRLQNRMKRSKRYLCRLR